MKDDGHEIPREDVNGDSQISMLDASYHPFDQFPAHQLGKLKMSRANVEQSLTGLIPTLNGPLPPELIELALSLLTRSRSVAHSLKPDEEIARPYACAQLACERLKTRLNLSTISSRPPCPPRIYKKLYSYLSSALPASTTSSSREPQTPRKNTASAPTSARNTPRTPMTDKRTPTSKRKWGERVEEVPTWVMPTIRALTKAFEFPNAVPHIYTGVESVLPLLARMSAAEAVNTPSKRSRPSYNATHGSSATLADARVLSLITVIFLYVFTRMKDEDVSPEQYDEWRKTTLDTLMKTPTGENVELEELSIETEELLPMAQSEGWLQMEWFLNVTPLAAGNEMEGVEATGNNVRPTNENGNSLRVGGSDYIGLGTMMQDATDYLGERQREDYKIWKARIMQKVEEIEAT